MNYCYKCDHEKYLNKKYWTGKELIEAGYLSALELGELARDGKITAWETPNMAHFTDDAHYQEIKAGAPYSASVIPFPFDFNEYALEYEGGIAGPVAANSYQARIEDMIFENNEIMRELLKAKGLQGEKALWEAILPELTTAEAKAAQAAICKLEGMSHTETYSSVFGDNHNATKESQANMISSMKKSAQALADKYDLKMPEWNIRNNMIKT